MCSANPVCVQGHATGRQERPVSKILLFVSLNCQLCVVCVCARMIVILQLGLRMGEGSGAGLRIGWGQANYELRFPELWTPCLISSQQLLLMNNDRFRRVETTPTSKTNKKIVLVALKSRHFHRDDLCM